MLVTCGVAREFSGRSVATRFRFRRIKIDKSMSHRESAVIFYRTSSGRIPVRRLRASSMNVDTIRASHRIHIENEQQLETAFAEYRQGPYRAFHFSHAEPHPWLAVLINDSTAYVHYFPTEGHAGFQSIAAPAPTGDSQQTVHFLQAGGCEADGFDMPTYTTVSAELGIAAARQFLHTPSLPTCIQWDEL